MALCISVVDKMTSGQSMYIFSLFERLWDKRHCMYKCIEIVLDPECAGVEVCSLAGVTCWHSVMQLDEGQRLGTEGVCSWVWKLEAADYHEKGTFTEKHCKITE